jgi:hypothetical protein
MGGGEVLCLAAKQKGRKADHSPQTSTEVKNASTTLCPFMVYLLKNRNVFLALLRVNFQTHIRKARITSFPYVNSHFEGQNKDCVTEMSAEETI